MKKKKNIEITTVDYFKKIRKTLKVLAEKNDCSFLSMAVLFTRAYLTCHVQLEEFCTLKLYRCSGIQLRQYLTYNECIRFSDKLSTAASAEDLSIFSEKYRFNAAFRDFVHRDWLYLPNSTPEDVQAFLDRNPVFLVKASNSTQGKDIFRYTSTESSAEALLQEYGNRPFLLEAFIRQHPAMAAINPDSVNTIRLITARKGSHIRFIGAGLRCGGRGQFVDNFHHGGAAYPVDLDSGLITGPGIDLDSNPILRHPTTGQVMPGFQIPFWEQVKEQTYKTASMSERVGYIGWDIAITEDGPEFIEGNIHYPGTTIIQLDGPGPWRRLRELTAQQ